MTDPTEAGNGTEIREDKPILVLTLLMFAGMFLVVVAGNFFGPAILESLAHGDLPAKERQKAMSLSPSLLMLDAPLTEEELSGLDPWLVALVRASKVDSPAETVESHQLIADACRARGWEAFAKAHESRARELESR